MAINLNDNIQINSNKALDNKSGIYREGVWTPYLSIQEVIDSIAPAYRHRGLTVQVELGGELRELWFKDGIEDWDLVPKLLSTDSAVTSVNGETGAVVLNFIDQNEKGAPNGVPYLDEDGIILSQFLPSSPDSLTFENGLRKSEGVVKLGLDPATNTGALTEKLLLLGGDFTADESYGLQIDSDGVAMLTENPNLQTHIGFSISSSGEEAYLNISKTIDGKTTGFQSSASQELIIVDQIANKGIVYSDNYSSNFTSRSLVDKEYVDNAINNASTNLTFTNGLREENGVVKLGLDTSDPTFTKGVLTEDTFIIGGDLSSNSYMGMIILPDVKSVNLSVVDGGVTHGLGVSNEIIQLERFKSGRQGILFSDTTSEVIDEINNKGLQYASDYSTNGKLDDRWIPDWGAVKSYVDDRIVFMEGTYVEENIILAAANIQGQTIQVVPQETLDVSRRRDVYLNGVLIANSLITISGNLLDINLLPMNLAAEVNDYLVIKYHKIS